MTDEKLEELEELAEDLTNNFKNLKYLKDLLACGGTVERLHDFQIHIDAIKLEIQGTLNLIKQFDHADISNIVPPSGSSTK